MSVTAIEQRRAPFHPHNACAPPPGFYEATAHPHKEIEAKFLVTPELLEQLIEGVQPCEIEQFYLSITPDGNTRVRRTVQLIEGRVCEGYEYTEKEKDSNDGASFERTVPIDAGMYAFYAARSISLGYRPVLKTRYETFFQGHICHVDVFGDDRTSFTVVEVEFAKKKRKKQFMNNLPPGFSHIPTDYRLGVSNRTMAEHGLPFWSYQ